jgi:hypothetical protein
MGVVNDVFAHESGINCLLPGFAGGTSTGLLGFKTGWSEGVKFVSPVPSWEHFQ